MATQNPIQNPEVNVFDTLRRLAPYIAIATAAFVLTACNKSDAQESTATPTPSTSSTLTPGTASPSSEPTPSATRTPETTTTSPGTPSTVATPEKSSTPEAVKKTVEEMEAMDYREFEQVDQPSKVAWRFSVMDNQEFIEEGIRWDRQKSNNGQYPDYYKLNNGKYNGMLLDNNYLVVKPSVNNTPQQILDLDNLALRYALWYIKDGQQMLDHNKLNKFINTQFFDARPGTKTYDLYKNVIASTSQYSQPTNISNVLNTGAKAGKVVQKKLGPNGEELPTMTFPVDFWQNGGKKSSEIVTYALTTSGENSLWQRETMEPIKK